MKTETEIYDVDWFIRFYEAIPEDKWTVNKLHDDEKSCALGHLCRHFEDFTQGAIIDSINQLFTSYFTFRIIVPSVNDGRIPEFQQPTPKQRILAALHKIKERQAVAKMLPELEENNKIDTAALELQAIGEANKILQEPLKLELVEQF